VLNHIYFGNILARITVALFCSDAHDAKHIDMTLLKYCQIEVFCFLFVRPVLKYYFIFHLWTLGNVFLSNSLLVCVNFDFLIVLWLI